MQEFKQHTGIAVPLNAANVDTDQIIPKQFLKAVSKIGFGKHAFNDWRYLDEEGTRENPDFVLNFPRYKGASILLARENFGNGSSREHAPWALEVNGIYAVIAPNFARIFYQNMYNCGLLALNMPKKDIDDMFRTFGTKDCECKIEQKEDGTWKVKLIAGSLSKSYPFKLEGFEKALIENEGWIGYAESKY